MLIFPPMFHHRAPLPLSTPFFMRSEIDLFMAHSLLFNPFFHSIVIYPFSLSPCPHQFSAFALLTISYFFCFFCLFTVGLLSKA